MFLLLRSNFQSISMIFLTQIALLTGQNAPQVGVRKSIIVERLNESLVSTVRSSFAFPLYTKSVHLTVQNWIAVEWIDRLTMEENIQKM